MSKLSATCNHFLRSLIKIGTKLMDTVGLKDDYPSSNLIDWRNRTTNKELYQISGTILSEDFQHQQHLKWIIPVT